MNFLVCGFYIQAELLDSELQGRRKHQKIGGGGGVLASRGTSGY